ncbi:MFS transporter [Paenibacillus beijingensis]|uniref:MFS transporter n=1 Tax=Paenibacillus beijingensis TaxID=1126833 RepID=A0A0D5NL71_9BACL|nr:MFS transporter [Paenibacillus beijingensis]AJY75742.1 MFS transporter [Paenibacillus beijingensis]
MKTAVWLYLFLFVAFFDLHAQYPILTPYAVSLGAAPSFIGLMMGLYSITHLPGNMIAGFSVDRYGSRMFIVFSLLGAGIILLLQSRAANPWQLLVLRSISGFVLAFLSPACMALLARMARSSEQQGKLMAGNGLVHTLASVFSPAAGAYLVAKLGFTMAFYLLGWILIATAVCALLFVRDQPAETYSNVQPGKAAAIGPRSERGGRAGRNRLSLASHTAPAAAELPHGSDSSRSYPWLVFLLPVALSCSQGILSFELPLMNTTKEGIMTTGLLFSVVSAGGLITLSMLFLNRLSAFRRSLWGAFMLALVYFAIAFGVGAPFALMLLLVGMAKGIIFPALSTLLIELSGSSRYGRTFSFLSIAFSVGSFLGPMLAGHLRHLVSPYYISFVVLMLAVTLLPFHGGGRKISARTHFT